MAETRLRRDRAVVALLIAEFCSAAASLAGITALGKLVYDMTGRELDLGLLGLAEFAPAALLVLVTGTVADRVDRRVVTSVSAFGECVVAVGLALYAATDPSAVGPIFAMVLLFGTARAFAAPSLRAMPADIVEAERLPWLVARFSATWQVAIIVGPVLAGACYAVEPWLAFVAMAVLLGAASLAILAVPARAQRPVAVAEADALGTREAAALDAVIEPSLGHGSAPAGWRASLHEAMEGLRFIRGQPVLLGAISLDLFAVLFGGAVALLPALAEDRLGVGAVGLGWLRAAGGIGAAVVTVGLARRPLTRNVGRTLLVVVASFGLGTIVLGVTTSFVVAFIAMAVLSGADAVSVFIRATLVPLITPSDKRGRVLAVENVFIGASNELGAFESGVAGQLLGAPGAVLLGGVATLTIAGTWWVRFPALRDVDRFPSSDS